MRINTHWDTVSALQVKLSQRRNTSESEWWVSHQRKLSLNICKHHNQINSALFSKNPNMRVCLLCCSGWPQSWRRGSQTSRMSPQGRMLSRWSVGPPPRREFHLCFAFLTATPPSGGPSRSDNQELDHPLPESLFDFPSSEHWRVIKYVTLAADEFNITGWGPTTARLLVWQQLLCVFLLSSVFVQVRAWNCLQCDSPAISCCDQGGKLPLAAFSPPVAFLRSRDANVFFFFFCSNGHTLRGRKARRSSPHTRWWLNRENVGEGVGELLGASCVSGCASCLCSLFPMLWRVFRSHAFFHF